MSPRWPQKSKTLFRYIFYFHCSAFETLIFRTETDLLRRFCWRLAYNIIGSILRKWGLEQLKETLKFQLFTPVVRTRSWFKTPGLVRTSSTNSCVGFFKDAIACFLQYQDAEPVGQSQYSALIIPHIIFKTTVGSGSMYVYIAQQHQSVVVSLL